MKLSLLLALPLLAACSTAPQGAPLADRAPAPQTALHAVAGDGAQVTSLGLVAGSDASQLAGSLRLRWPVLPGRHDVHVVARDASGAVVLDTVVRAEVRRATFRHRTPRTAVFRVDLGAPAPAALEVTGPVSARR